MFISYPTKSRVALAEAARAIFIPWARRLLVLSIVFGSAVSTHASEIQKIIRPILDEMNLQASKEGCSDLLNSGLPLKTQVLSDPSYGDIGRIVRLERALAAIEDRYALVIAASLAIREFQVRHKELSDSYQRLHAQLKEMDRRSRLAQSKNAKLRKLIPQVEALRDQARPLLQILTRMDDAGKVQADLLNVPEARNTLTRLITELSDVILGTKFIPGGAATISRATDLHEQIRFLMFEMLGDTNQLTSIMIDEARIKRRTIVDSLEGIQAIFSGISDRFNGQNPGPLKRYDRGMISRSPKNELILRKTSRGYQLQYATADSSTVMDRVLLDPDLIYQGLARGQFFESDRGELLGVVGFRPYGYPAPENVAAGVVVVQHFDYDRNRIRLFEVMPEILHGYRRLNVTNINRPLLVGDVVIIKDIQNPKQTVQIPSVDFDGFFSDNHTTLPMSKFHKYWGAARFFLPIAVGVGIGAVLDGTDGAVALGMAGGFISVVLSVGGPPYLGLQRGPDGYQVLRSVTPRSKDWMLARNGLLRRPENFWISSQSLNESERSGLNLHFKNAEGSKINPITEWFVSPSGRIVTAEKGSGGPSSSSSPPPTASTQRSSRIIKN